MNITVTGRHLEVSGSTKSYLEEKFGKIDRFCHDVSDAEIVLKQEDRSIHCEAILHIRNHPNIVIDVARESMHEAIDLAIDKCERQLRRLKEKRDDRRKHGAGNHVPPMQDESADENA